MKKYFSLKPVNISISKVIPPFDENSKDKLNFDMLDKYRQNLEWSRDKVFLNDHLNNQEVIQ